MPNKFDHSLEVVQAIEDHIAQTGKLPSTTDIKNLLHSFPDRQIYSLLDRMVKDNLLTIVFEAPKNPTIYAPTYMYDAMQRGSKVPKWMDMYEFEEADTIKKEIRAKEDRLTRYKRIEALLYGTGKTLEESVASTLDFLDAEKLETPFSDPNSWDLNFEINGVTYIGEIKGKAKYAEKEDVSQLVLWTSGFLDKNPDADPTKIKGLLIINHYRDLDPAHRWPNDQSKPPISEAAEKYLKLTNMAFLTTLDIYNIAREKERNRQVDVKERVLESISSTVRIAQTTR